MNVYHVWQRCCFFGKLRRKRRKEQQSKWYLYFQPPLEGVNSHWFIPKYHKPFKWPILTLLLIFYIFKQVKNNILSIALWLHV